MTDERNNGTASVNPAFAEAWDQGVCKPPSVAIRSLHNVINRYLAATHPEQVEGLSGGNIDIITFLARHSEREIFPQDVERRFGVTRSTSSRVLGLMEKKGLIARESVPRDARLKKIVLTEKSRDIAEALRESAIAMEGILLQGLSDDDIRRFMQVLDMMQSNLVETGRIGDESRYSSLAICDPPAGNEGKEEE
ncbi:MarR family winged helix-turn-helix transcriptional regulator [Bifidobacterium moukalabense]|uniref:MarR family winged helix-turn-helix transcriptional regulator n=1 Tax=Bifidobacterium moukalabense TaxID=1333651 RepID=UPI001F1C66BC|nr:MarR family winged helix-turn-helix transcriptional regulator [Bifidobacterium moukalabense]